MTAPKTVNKWQALILPQLGVKLVIVVVSFLGAFVMASGSRLVNSWGVDAKTYGKAAVLEFVGPALDSLRKRQDSLDALIRVVQINQERSEKINRAFFGAMMNDRPSLKKEVENLGKQNQDAEKKKKLADTLLSNLATFEN